MKHFSGTMGKTELMQELTDKIEAYLTDKFENSPMLIMCGKIVLRSNKLSIRFYTR